MLPRLPGSTLFPYTTLFRSDVPDVALEVQEHIRRQAGDYAVAEGPAELARTDRHVHVALLQHPAGQLRETRGKPAVRLEHPRSRGRERIPPAGLAEGRVDVVPAHLPDSAEPALDREIVLKDAGVPGTDGQQGLDRLLGHVVHEVAHRDRRAVLAQAQVLLLPVRHEGFVDLTDHVGVLREHPVQLTVGRLAHAGVRVAHVYEQVLAGERTGLAV